VKLKNLRKSKKPLS